MVPGTGRKEARCILSSFVQTSCGVILAVPLGRLLRMFARVPVLYVCVVRLCPCVYGPSDLYTRMY